LAGGPTLTAYWQRWHAAYYNQGIERASQEFEKRTGCRVEIVWAGSEDLRMKYNTAIETDTLPDLGEGMAFYPALFHRLGILEETGEVVDRLVAEYGDFHGEITPYSKFGDAFYAVPLFTVVEALHVRTDRLAQAGLGLPDTWEEVLTAARKTTDRAQHHYGFGEGPSRSNVDHEKWVRAMLWSHGAGVFGEGGRTVALDAPGTMEVLQWVQEGWDAGVFPPDALQWGPGDNNKSWLSGQATMIWNAASTLADTREEVPELLDRCTMVRVPAGPAGRHSFASGHFIMQFKDSAHPELTRRFVAFLFERERYIGLTIPYLIPVFASLAQGEAWENPLDRVFLENTRYIRPVGYPGPVTVTACEVMNRMLLADLVSSMLLYELTPEEAVAQHVPRIQAVADWWQE
jgi:ABC-type glycerol-3-phosphate transport system substrate-binding protein